MNSNQFFIIGLRRSGTSILRNLISRSPGIKSIQFEPHELFQSAQNLKIKRYKNSKYYLKVINNFLKTPALTGAKMVFNPGIDALDWIWLDSMFNNPRFIFIIRNPESTFNSYYKQDMKTRRGVIPKDIYIPFNNIMTHSFESFAELNPKRAIIINYDKMLKNVDDELMPIWDLLNIKSPGSLTRLIKHPNN